MSVTEVVTVSLHGAERNPAQSILANSRVSDAPSIGLLGVEGGCDVPVNLENPLSARLVGNNINI